MDFWMAKLPANLKAAIFHLAYELGSVWNMHSMYLGYQIQSAYNQIAPTFIGR